jgi:sugar lactone lactonase YvrE
VEIRNTSWHANYFVFDTDAEKNICLSFEWQNRIEKLSKDGRIVWRADRPLNYGTDINRNRIDKNSDVPSNLNIVSMGIAMDGKGRIWVNTFHRQMTPEEQSLSISGRIRTKEGKISKMNIHKLESFDPDGVLLGEIPLDHLAHGLRHSEICF